MLQPYQCPWQRRRLPGYEMERALGDLQQKADLSIGCWAEDKFTLHRLQRKET